MISYEKCLNCGADYSLHHYQTLQCPVHGREAPIGHKQEYMTQTFESKDKKDEIIKDLLEACKAAVAMYEQLYGCVNAEWDFIKAAITKAEKG